MVEEVKVEEDGKVVVMVRSERQKLESERGEEKGSQIEDWRKYRVGNWKEEEGK